MKNYMNIYDGINEYANDASKDYPNVSIVDGIGLVYQTPGMNYFMDEKALKEFTYYNENGEVTTPVTLQWYDTFTLADNGEKSPTPNFVGGEAIEQLGALNAENIAKSIYNEWDGWVVNVTYNASDEGIFLNVYDDKGRFVLEVRRTQNSGAKAPASDLLFEISSDGSEWGYQAYVEGVFAFYVYAPERIM